jgi:6-pyruvoyltetrahydropterin/6-carboxytetrahydropterin synthase
MSEAFSVRVENLQFDAAHFETFGNNTEPLHGHSYHVAAEVEGELTPDSLVVDFVLLKTIIRGLCKQLDHRFLLQENSRHLEIETVDASWKIRTRTGLGYVFPKQDVIALPIDNSSAERLSEWMGALLWQALEERGVNNLRSVTLEVYEGPGQRASHRMERPRAD